MLLPTDRVSDPSIVPKADSAVIYVKRALAGRFALAGSAIGVGA